MTLKIFYFRLNSASDQLISPKCMPGSFHYCAPENFRFKYEDGTYEDDVNSDSDSECEDKGDTHIELTIKADIWAVGIILYKMVYDGVHPYAAVCGGRSSKIFVLKSSVEIEFPVTKHPENVSNGLFETLKTVLRKDPKERAEAHEILRMEFLSGPLFKKI